MNGAYNRVALLSNSFLKLHRLDTSLIEALGPATAVSLFNTALFGCLTGLLQGFSLRWVRLSVRTQAFHVCKTGSIPVPSTTLEMRLRWWSGPGL